MCSCEVIIILVHSVSGLTCSDWSSHGLIAYQSSSIVLLFLYFFCLCIYLHYKPNSYFVYKVVSYVVKGHSLPLFLTFNESDSCACSFTCMIISVKILTKSTLCDLSVTYF